ncbi:MAG TPA: biopolymer transporter ExbD [Polyangiaceae bacterium]|nr:biopolymer transporter ExbD [Polyangiaceae bacterium]
MQSSSNADESITGINVTPLVDVVLVLLVVLMVTATYLASRAIPVDLPTGKTGEATAAPLTVSLTKSGSLYVDGVPCSEAELRQKLVEARKSEPDLRAVIAADGAVPHRRVVGIIDLLRQEHVDRFAINVDADDLAKP